VFPHPTGSVHFKGRDWSYPGRYPTKISEILYLSQAIDQTNKCLISHSCVADSEPIRLSDSQRLDWLRLIRSENVGPRGIMAQTPLA
jgi:hypothetical protein